MKQRTIAILATKAPAFFLPGNLRDIAVNNASRAVVTLTRAEATPDLILAHALGTAA